MKKLACPPAGAGASGPTPDPPRAGPPRRASGLPLAPCGEDGSPSVRCSVTGRPSFEASCRFATSCSSLLLVVDVRTGSRLVGVGSNGIQPYPGKYTSTHAW